MLDSRRKKALLRRLDASPELAQDVSDVIGRDIMTGSDSDRILAISEFIEAGFDLAPLAKARDITDKLHRQAAQARGESSLADQLALAESREEQLRQELLAARADLAELRSRSGEAAAR